MKNPGNMPVATDPLEQMKRFLADQLAQAAGIEIAPVQTDPTEAVIQIESWEDWTRIIHNFKSLAEWHRQAWAWAWAIRKGIYQRPFVAIAPRGGGKSSSAEAIIAALGARATRRYGLYVRATQAQANASIANVASIFENSKIGEYYPLMGQRLISDFGQSKGWNRTMIRTASGFTLSAFGLDSALRGVKVDDDRPDFMCHQVGTPIYDPDLGKWMKVEEHPSFLGFRSGSGYKISIAGSPYPEIVTPEHRFWSRYKPKVFTEDQSPRHDETPKWCEAKDLETGANQFIGLPIDQTVVPIPPLPVVHVVSDEFNISKYTIDVLTQLPEMHDPDWWWFFGLWWRYGMFSNGSIVVSFGGKADHEKSNRLMKLLDKYNYPYNARKIDPRKKVYHITFRHDTLFRWLSSWEIYGYGQRKPPIWVERIDHEYQKQLILGFINLSNKRNKTSPIEIETADAEDLLWLRRILARLGVPAIVYFKKARSKKRPLYVLYLRDGMSDVFGFDILPSRIHAVYSYIEDKMLWNRVTGVEPVSNCIFAPITTKSHIYFTHGGQSHNCFDDIDEKHDSPGVTTKKIETITKSILPAGSSDMTVLAIQNLIIEDGVFARMANNTADFLADRILVGPVPAVEDLEYRVINNIPEITGGRATWSGQSLEVCEQQMTLWGPRAFLAEAQHLVNLPEGGTFDGLVFPHIADADLPELIEVVCWIDPAVTSKTKSHCQAIQIDGLEKVERPKLGKKPRRGRIYRMYSWEGIDSPENVIRRGLREATARNAKKIGIETNQGGDLWEGTYFTIAEEMVAEGEIDYVPIFDSAKAGSHTGGKEDRAGRMLTDYTRGYFVHVEGTHQTLENALARFPLILPDDLIDAAYWAWSDLRKNDKNRGRHKSGRISRGQLFGGRRAAGARAPAANPGGSRAGYLRRLGLR